MDKRLTDKQLEQLLETYKEKYEKETKQVIESRSPNDLVLNELYQVICALSDLKHARGVLRSILYGAQSVSAVIRGYDYYRGMNEAAQLAAKGLENEIPDSA
jgi:hypothetical protein